MMKVLYDPVSDMIIAFGPNLEGENIYQGPVDFDFEKYEYHSEIPGFFNPDGFIIKPLSENCPVCGKPFD
jgi:hypothetical protein